MKLNTFLMMMALSIATLVSAKDGGQAVDVAAQYQQKSARMAEQARAAENPELRNAYSALSRNYAQMSAMKRDAEQRAARGQAMDWTEYHKLQGDNRAQEAVIARHRAGQRGHDVQKPDAPAVPRPDKSNLPERIQVPAHSK